MYSGNLNDIPFVANKMTIYRSASNSVNAPVPDYGLLETLYIDSAAFAIQRFTSLTGSPRLWIRAKMSGAWEAWVEK